VATIKMTVPHCVSTLDNWKMGTHVVCPIKFSIYKANEHNHIFIHITAHKSFSTISCRRLIDVFVVVAFSIFLNVHKSATLSVTSA